MYILMRRWFSALWLYLELITGFSFIGSGAYELFISDSGSQICSEISLCDTEILGIITPWLFVCFGMLVIIIWYLTTYLPHRENESKFTTPIKPEDFVK